MPKNKIKDSGEVEEGLSESATSKSDEFSEAAKVKDCKVVLVRLPENLVKPKSRSVSPEIRKLEEPIQYALNMNDDVITPISEENRNDSGIFSCVVVYSRCEMRFNNDQDLINHCLQIHDEYLKIFWKEAKENDNDQAKFEIFCKEFIMELLLAEYKHHTKRLKTFENWSNKSVNPVDLAKAGLLFTGSEDNVKCVYCGIEIDEWQDFNVPLDIHRDGAPDCPLVLDRSIEIIANNRFSCPYSKDCLEKYSTVQSLKKHAIEFHHNLTKKDMNMKNEKEIYSISLRCCRLLSKEYKSEPKRRATYVDWLNPYVTADELANSGFLYTGWGANVQCVFCDFVIQNWKSGDTIKNKHPRAHCASAIRQKNRQHESTTTAEDSKASTSTTATAREISNQNSKGQNDFNVADYVPKEKYSKYRSIQKSTNSDRK